MKGHIRRRGDNSWAVVIYVGKDAAGKDKYRWYSVKGTKKQAEAKLAELLHQMSTGGYVDPARVTLSQFLDRWVEDYVKTALRPRSQKRYRGIIDHHLKPRLGHIQLSKLTALHLQNYYAAVLQTGRIGKDGKPTDEPLSPASVLYHHRVLHRALAHAVRWGLAARNVADAVDPPKTETPEIHPLNQEQAQRLLAEASKTSQYALYATALGTGMRQGELLGLQWKDVDLDAGAISVVRQASAGEGRAAPKTRRSIRRIAISPELVQILRQHRARQNEQRLKMGPRWEDHGLVFPARGGRPLSARNLDRQFKNLLKKAKLPEMTRFHDLRHTHATLLLLAGVHPKVVSERLGHASIAITMDIYSHVLPTMQEQAAANLDRILFLEPSKDQKTGLKQRPV